MARTQVVNMPNAPIQWGSCLTSSACCLECRIAACWQQLRVLMMPLPPQAMWARPGLLSSILVLLLDLSWPQLVSLGWPIPLWLLTMQSPRLHSTLRTIKAQEICPRI